MNTADYHISLDVHEALAQVALRVKQGDTARKIYITLTENGKPYQITDDCNAVFTAKKPDGNILYNACVLQGNVIVYALTAQTTAAAGELLCELRLYGADSALITSPCFALLVDETVYSDGDVVESASEASELIRLLDDTQAVKAEVEEALASGAFKGEKGDTGETSLPLARASSSDGIAYTASGETLPGVSSANSQEQIEAVGKGRQIVFIPWAQNKTSAPTLQLNGGEIVPIRLRAPSNQGSDDTRPDATLPLPVGALMRGVPYTLTFCGKYWLVDSLNLFPIPSEADVGKVLTVDDAGKAAWMAASASGTNIPDYIQTAAEAVAKTVNRRQSENSVCFAFMTDAHLGYYTDLENVAGKHAGMALKVINARCLLDFVAHGGDYTTGAWNTTVDATFEDMEDYMELIGSMTAVPQVWAIGNHDDAPYQATADRLTQTQSFAAVGRKNRGSNAVCYPGCNYGYLDLESQKVRVIYLDTHDKRGWGTVAVGAGETAPGFLYADNIGGAQLKFLADVALDFSAKADPSEWAVIVVSHAVLSSSGTYTDVVSGESHDANTANAALILSAYQSGGSGTLTNNGVSVTYDFSSQDSRAALICCVHGNDHKYADEIVGSGLLSICCPNICNGRERESADGNTYIKTAGTAEGTSFCIITVDRVNRKIYADHYGAGIDREFEYTVPIPGGYTNLLSAATDADGNILNGVGYQTGYRLSSDGSATGATGFTVTGFIPCAWGDVVRLKNITMQPAASTATNQRISFYDSNKAHLVQTNANAAGSGLAAVTDSDGNIVQFTVQSFSGNDLTNAAYFRLNGTYIGEDSVITVNEEII